MPLSLRGWQRYWLTNYKETKMKVAGWTKITLAGLLSVAALAGSAAIQDKPKEPAKEVHLVTASTPRERQIELALSAAPTEVSSKAGVYILGPKGYEKVREGTNGFSCLIERSFKGTTQTSSAPACFDAEGSRTIMLAYLRREELRAQGKSEGEIKEDVAKGYKDGRFKAPGPGFLYMMSSENYVYDSESKKSGFVPPHLMFYAPYKTAKDVGYEKVSPTMVPYLTGSGIGPESLLVVAVEKPSQDSSSGDSHKD
ncbi:MAG: hypothetical protein WBD59_22680 [Candidatus Sulfotelmatobacter sp.]